MITYKIFVDERFNSNPLKIKVTNNRKTVYISTGLSVTPGVLQDILSPITSPENLVLKSTIFEWVSAIEDIRAGLVREGRGNIAVEDIRDLILVAIKKKSADEIGDAKKSNFASYFERRISRVNNQSYRASWLYTLNKMREFDPDFDKLKFDDVTLRWLNDFNDWLISKGSAVNSRNIHFKNIRTCLNRAIDDELTVNYPFRRFHIRPEETRKRSLSVEKLRMLFDYDCEEYAIYYRDIFKLIFMLCGINCIDLYNLKPQLCDGRIEYRRAKTKKLYSIKVEPEAMELIEKYRGKSGLVNISDRWKNHHDFIKQINIALKKIGTCTRSGLGGKKNIVPEFPEISTYWARHSWATIAASLDIPKETIAAALGHEIGNRITSVYIDFDMRKVDEANRRVIDWVLYGKK